MLPLRGKTPCEIGPLPFLSDAFPALLGQVLATGAPQLRAALGAQYFQTQHVSELHDGHVHTVLSITHDVLELKHAELASAAQVHFNEQLATTSPDRIQVRARNRTAANHYRCPGAQ